MTPDNLHPLPRVIRLSQIPPKIEMTIFRTDRLFAEAARNPERCDKLLKSWKRGRLVMLIFLIVFGALAIAGLCYELSRLHHFMDVIIDSKFGDKSPDGPKLSPFASLTLFCSITFFSEMIFLSYADTCVKMLVILQQQQKLTPPADASGPS